MRASIGLGSLLVAALLTTVHGAGQPTHQELVATIDRLEARMDAMEHKVATLEKEDASQQRIISELQSTVDRQAAALRDYTISCWRHNRVLSNRVQRLERKHASKAKPAGTPTNTTEQQPGSRWLTKTKKMGISAGDPSLEDSPNRSTRKHRDAASSGHSHSAGKYKRLLLTSPVNTPVAFMARMDAGHVSIDTNDSYVFERVLMNFGNGYHASHGLFMAPRPGIYMFSAAITTGEFNEDLDADIVHNGFSICKIYAYDANRREQGTHTVLIQLKQDDEVWVRSLDLHSISAMGSGFSSFSGYLLYEM